MIKKLFCTVFAVISLSFAYAANFSDNEQKQVAEKVIKKVLRAQVAGKSNVSLLDEITKEVATEFDDSGEFIEDKNSKTILIVGGIVVGCVALGIGGYLWYKHYRSKQVRPYVENPWQQGNIEDEVVSVSPIRVHGFSPHQNRGQLTVQQNQMLNAIINQLPHDVQQPFREAIRNGSDENLVNFVNAAIQNTDGTRASARNFENIVAPAIQRLTLQQQLSLINAGIRYI